MTSNADTRIFVRHALIVLGLVVLALLAWRIAYALLLAFGGVLFAVFLRGVAGKVHAWTGLGTGWSLGVTGLALLALLVAAAALIGPSIASELDALGETIRQGLEKARSFLEQRPLGRQLVDTVSQSREQGSGLLRAAAGIARGVADAVLALVLVLFAGIYLAASPYSYRDGLVRLVPPARQDRARELMDTVGNALWLWLLGQFVVMLAVGVLTALGLLLVGVPLALALGVVAGLLEFIPFLGPILAAVPIILVALTVDVNTALLAGVVVLVIQQAESHLLAPLVERRAVALPPVLVLVGTIAFTLLFGIIGTVFAAPLLVVAMVAIKMLYVEDALGQRAEVPGRSSD